MQALDAIDVGGEIRAAMGRSRVSMAQLARETGIPRTTLAYQINANLLTVSNLIRIAAALGVPVSALLGEVAA